MRHVGGSFQEKGQVMCVVAGCVRDRGGFFLVLFVDKSDKD